MSPPPPEKNKKVSRACNTCRLKRKKCDGLEPCIFCTETRVECSYSREPRRRGPPSGYLRFTETRVALLETLLGLYIQTTGPQTARTLNEVVQTLAADSTAHTTQDVWDAYKQNWTDSDASRAVQELAAVFAPFTPVDNQTPGPKTLLPAPQGGQPPQPAAGKQPPPPPPRSPSPFPATPVNLYTNESFERSVMPNDLEEHQYPHEGSLVPNDLRYQYQDEPVERSVMPNDPSPIHDQQHQYANDDVPDLGLNLHTELSMPMPPMPLPVFLLSPPPDPAPPASSSISVTEYPGAYWHTAALASPPQPFAALPAGLSPALAGLFPPAASLSAPPPVADLPPPHVRAALLDTYRAAVHPALPILSPAQCASPAALESSPMLLLALCAYTARLAPPAVPTRVAADLWYESTSALLSSALRRASVAPDTVQTLLFLALRDHGRARDALAWRGVGTAVRVAVELGLDVGEPNSGDTNSSESRAVGDDTWKRDLWGVASMLDLFLSIQLGRAPASAEALRPLALTPAPAPPTASTSAMNAFPSLASTSSPHTIAPNATNSTSADESAADAELAAHTRALVRIVARVHFCVALGYGESSSSTSGRSTAHAHLRAELAAWHRGLPQRFRVALGGERVPRAVLEAHMLYQVAVGMLARASSPHSNSEGDASSSSSGRNGYGGSFGANVNHNGAGNGSTDAEADDAASTFNVLLDKYRPSLPLAGPPVVWLVFAAARAGLQRAPAAAKSAHGVGGGMGMGGTARALQTQLYLLNCREALASMGGTWELARRCARTLERLMEGEAGSRPHSTAGKRKRGDGEAGGSGSGSGSGSEDGRGGGGGKRLREEGSVGAGWAEQFDFGAGWGAELDELGMGVWGASTNDSGLWDTGAWDEGLWGRSVLGGGGGGGFGLGLFDVPPGG